MIANKSFDIAKASSDSVDKRMREWAFGVCDHRAVCFAQCRKTKECSNRAIVNWLWKLMVRGN